MKKVLLLFLLLSVSLFSQNLTNIKLQLQWKHQFEFAGFYAALEQGYYKDAGLDVEFIEYKGTQSITDTVLNKQADMGLTYSSLISEYLNNKPVLFVANYFKQSPLVFVTQKDIVTPRDLKGKKVMGGSDSIDNISLEFMLKKFDLTKNDITIVKPTFNIEDFINKKIDAMLVFKTNELYTLNKMNYKFNILNPTIYGQEYYDVNLFTSKDFALKNQEAIKKFRDASNRGWYYALKHKEKIVNLILKKYNTQNKTKESLLFEANQIEQIILSNVNTIGDIDINRVKLIADNFIEAGYATKEKLNHLDEFIFDLSLQTKEKTDTTITQDKDSFEKIQSQIQLTKQERIFLDNHPVIKVYMDYAYPPYSFVENGNLKGFSVEYATLLSKLLGVEFQYIQNMTWDEGITNLKEKKIDMIAQMVNNESRRKFTLFTQDYYSYFTGIVTKRGNDKFSSLKDLEGKTVGLVKGYFEEALLKEHYPKIELQTYKDTNELLNALIENQFDAIVLTYQVLEYMINKKGLQDTLINTPMKMEPILGVTQEAFGIRDDWKLFQSSINKVISLTNSYRNSLEQQWLNAKHDKKKDIPILNDNERAYLKKKEYITMCIDPDWEPYEKIDKDGKHIGIAADFIKLIETKINKEIKLIPTKSWSQSEQFAKEQKCEILSFLNRTPQREKFLNFTPTFYEEPEVILTRNDVPFIDGFESLELRKVGIVEGYATDEYLRKHYPKVQIKYTKNSQEGIEMVSEGKIYANVNSLLGTAHLIRKLNLINVKISGKTNIFNKYRVGIVKDDLLLHSILSKAVKSITDQEKKNITNNWISVRFEKNIDYSLLWKVLGGISLIIIFLLYRDYAIRKINKELEKKMNLQIKEMQEKDNMLQQQARLAQMGEMINMIAHQWRQPLGAISSTIIAMDMSLHNKQFHLETKENNEEYKKYLDSKFDKISQYIQVLSTTVDDFRNFFKPDKNRHLISLEEPINMALNIIEPSIKTKRTIEIIKQYNSKEKISAFKNELMQVILNILKNAEDNFIEQNIDNPTIHIEVNKTDTTHIIKICDNGGGIPENIIDTIFDPYFSTKDSSDGTGIGLYMSKIIIEKHHKGKLTAYNYNDGVCFTIELQ